MTAAESAYIAPRLGGFSARLALAVRRQIFQQMMQRFSPPADWPVLDVGVTSDRTADSNFFEAFYPHPDQITAVGLEDAFFLEQLYPGLRFVRADGRQLPFANAAFRIAFCSAVIEHVGNRAHQLQLLVEMLRVAENCIITTPNRWFPLEFHTLTPLLHWLPQRWFRAWLRWRGEYFFADEANLNLLGAADLLQLAHQAIKESGRKNLSVRLEAIRLLGWPSNLVLSMAPVAARQAPSPASWR
jgi:SAM-dependent methyltransferase